MGLSFYDEKSMVETTGTLPFASDSENPILEEGLTEREDRRHWYCYDNPSQSWQTQLSRRISSCRQMFSKSRYLNLRRLY